MQIPSDKVVFNEKPDMKAREITDAGKAALASGKYDMVRVNYANPDMVGHTGDLQATMQARSPPLELAVVIPDAAPLMFCFLTNLPRLPLSCFLVDEHGTC